MGHYTASLKRVREIAKRREGRSMWTKERPSKAGWYWFRDEDGLFVMEVYFYARKNCLMARCSSGDFTVEALDGEWHGPLEVPE